MSTERWFHVVAGEDYEPSGVFTTSAEKAAHERAIALAAEGAVKDGQVVTCTVIHHGVFRVLVRQQKWHAETVATGEARDSGADHECG